MIERIVAYVLYGILLGLVAVGILGVIQEHQSLEYKSSQAQVIYSKLVKYTGVPGAFPSKITILNDEEINAYASAEGVFVTTGMLNMLNTDSEISAIIGHELGHIILGHLDDTRPFDNRILEANADKYGSYLVMRAGYDVCAARDVWIRIADVLGDSILTSSHPSDADRAYSLDFPQCHH